MALQRFTLNYGNGTVSFGLPEEQVLCEILGHPHPAVDLQTAYRHALDHPIDAPPLRELVRPGERVTIGVSDITRVWQRNDLSLPILLETLNAAGVPDENVTIVIAVGGHRLNTPDEHMEICGRKVCHRVKVLNHDAHDLGNMIYLGRTSRGTEVRVSRLAMEADRLILTGGTIYHYMSGYGGGRKSILPGLSYIDTIRQNHVLGLAPAVGRGSNPLSASRITRGNALHEDMMEIAGFVQPDFLVNIVPTLEGGVAGVFAGNWVFRLARGDAPGGPNFRRADRSDGGHRRRLCRGLPKGHQPLSDRQGDGQRWLRHAAWRCGHHPFGVLPGARPGDLFQVVWVPEQPGPG